MVVGKLVINHLPANVGNMVSSK